MLERWRDQIDQIDDQLLELLNRRARIALRLAGEKRARCLPVLDPDREAQVIRRLSALNRGPLPPEALARIYQTIMAEMRRLQQGA